MISWLITLKAGRYIWPQLKMWMGMLDFKII